MSDLKDYNQTEEILRDLYPDAIVHLAARVGGIKDNSENQAEFYLQNTLINYLKEKLKNTKVTTLEDIKG